MRRSPLRSPPRMRGKAHVFYSSLICGRITPACAGKSVKVNEPDCLPRDHPRVCGEKNGICRAKVPHLGSPPRVRGKGFLHFAHKMLEGITPAYAGKSKTSAAGCPGCRDHPRVCGEKPPSCPEMSTNEGSPPRMRGKECSGRLQLSCYRITPAYAGKSMMLHHSIPDTAAHDGRQVLRGLRRHLKCDWDGHLRLVQVGNVVHERALMPDVHESQPRRTPQRHNDRMGQPVQAGMHGGSHGCRGRAAAPKCPAHHPWLLPPCRMVIKPRP